MSDIEIELKLRIKDKTMVIKKLSDLGAKFITKRKQSDILFNSKHFDFGEFDQSLRIRIEKSDKGEFSELAFKGTPKHTKEGHKIRDEFQMRVDGGTARKILTSIGFNEADVIEKERQSYELKGLNIEIDELKFGTFIEFEGKPKAIEELRRKLGLENVEPIKQGYADLQLEWDAKHK